MKAIYFFDAQGKKVFVEVNDEVAEAYRKCQREEWRNDAYEKYHSKSLDKIIESGHDFEDKRSYTEELYVEREEKAERQAVVEKLKEVLPLLTDLQRETIHKLFELNMSQSEIAREEGVAHQVINKRVARV